MFFAIKFKSRFCNCNRFHFLLTNSIWFCFSFKCIKKHFFMTIYVKHNMSLRENNYRKVILLTIFFCDICRHIKYQIIGGFYFIFSSMKRDGFAFKFHTHIAFDTMKQTHQFLNIYVLHKSTSNLNERNYWANRWIGNVFLICTYIYINTIPFFAPSKYDGTNIKTQNPRLKSH